MRINLYVASGNPHKVREIAPLLAPVAMPVVVHGADVTGGMPLVDESADSFSGNALLKATALHKMLAGAEWVLADDSGLQVDALGGAPGIYSSRFAGPDASDRDNVEQLLRRMAAIPDKHRTARFVCALILLDPTGRVYSFAGECEGHILRNPTGDKGFGYDPVFVPIGYGESFGQLGSTVKQSISHRARAMARLVQFFEEYSRQP